MGATANDGVFQFLAKRPSVERSDQPVTMPDDPKRDYYLEAGSHPEIVERLWDQLGKDLPPTSRVLVFGTPALIHPGSGVVLAFAFGTQYALRLPRSLPEEKRPAGLRTVATWTGGGSTDIERECGNDWIFGSFSADETVWCDECFLEAGESAG
jgi:hypothetical protein